MHVHVYKVMPSSTFGLKKVNAVLVCDGVVDEKPCRHSMTKVLRYAECIQKSVGNQGRIEYFWKETGGIDGAESQVAGISQTVQTEIHP